MIDYAKDLLKMPPDPSLLDDLWFGVEVMLIGMAIVFAVLILLWGILELFGFVSKKIIEKTSDPAKIALPENTDEEEDEEEEEAIAVITAAVSAALEKPVSGFRVVSFKKRNEWKFM